ncbi:MAG TPA: hypothetical protein VKA60_11515 [Blastocatellia bacterium]|nr:hypothetical protein [Blastocatellia bacterium]
MFLVPLIWLQSAPLSKTTIAIASLVFVLAIILLVYFVRKLRASSKVEEDWSLTRSSLFVEKPSEQFATEATPAEEESAPQPVVAASETRLLASEPLDTEAPAAEVAPPAPISQPGTIEMAAPPKPVETPPAPEPQADLPPARDERRTQFFSSPTLPPRAPRPTEVLSSPPPAPPVAAEEEIAAPPATSETTPFDEGVWAGISESKPPQADEATHELRSPAAPPVAPSPDVVEPLAAARVEQRAPRAPFEPPAVEPLRQSREPFEPPVINPLTPREQTALLGARPGAASEEPPAERPSAKSDLPYEAPRAEPTVPLYSDRAPRRDQAVEVSARSAHRPAGAVLGLPVESGGGPLVLGTPAKPREEIGIGSLTDYGKVDKEGGRGGLIVLAIALLLFGGAALAYFFVPSVHDRANTWIARARGVDPNEATSSQPKAMIFPARAPASDKNLVHATGNVQNISNEALENLALDVQLNKSGGDTEMINVQVTPSPLAPNDQGNYAFDYDGKGVLSYTIKRLSSNGKEVRFTAPGQK